MENKHVGLILIGVSLVMAVMVFLFNSSLQTTVKNICPYVREGLECPAHAGLTAQLYLTLSIVGILLIVGLVLVFAKSDGKVVVRTIKEKVKKKEFDVSSLKAEEKLVFKIVREQGTIFQADLIEKTRFGKAKVTRILDRLEGQGFVERKRRGMTNVVVLKN